MQYFFKDKQSAYIGNPIIFKMDNPKSTIKVATFKPTREYNINGPYKEVEAVPIMNRSNVLLFKYKFNQRLNNLKEISLQNRNYKAVKRMLDCFFIEKDYFTRLRKYKNILNVYNNIDDNKVYIVLKGETDLEGWDNDYIQQEKISFVNYNMRIKFFRFQTSKEDVFKYTLKTLDSQQIKSPQKYKYFYQKFNYRRITSQELEKIKKIMAPKGHYYYIKQPLKHKTNYYDINNTFQEKLNILLNDYIKDILLETVSEQVKKDESLKLTQKIVKDKCQNIIKKLKGFYKLQLCLKANIDFLIDNRLDNLYKATNRVYDNVGGLNSVWKKNIKEKIIPDNFNYHLNDRDFYRLVEKRLK